MENNNKLIAEFLGLEVEEGQERIYINGLGTKLIEETFNTDWNWLMQVVDKIESFEDDNRCAKYNVNIEQTFVEITENHTSMTITETDANTKIRAIYIAVVEFIKWYNEQ